MPIATPIPNPIQKFALGFLLSTWRGLRQLKNVIVKLTGRLTAPFRAVGRFLFHTVLVPFYQLTNGMRRKVHSLYLPAKSRVLFLLTHRYAIHAAIATVAIVTVGVNVQAQEVRSEGFGEQSILYTLLAGENQSGIEEVTAQEVVIPTRSSYREEVALTSAVAKNIDFDFIGEDYVSDTSFGATTTETVPERDTIESYIVQSGDTIGTIAQKFGLSITTVLWANDLSVRSTIRPDDQLVILPADGVVHEVKSGDTLSSIANKYRADSDEIETFNKLASVDDLRIGEELMVPGGELQATQPTRRVASVSNIFTTPPSSAAGSTATTTAGGMIWPTVQRVITQHYSWRHIGVDIDCPNGTHNAVSNFAAADGIVTYSGWKGGYGYTVDIDHGNGLMTRYAHHSRLYVSSGQSVTQGQAIGECGSTGFSTGDHLHFEVRKSGNGDPQNPFNHIIR